MTRRLMPAILVTRPQPQADDWVAQLRALGLEAAALPLLAIAGPADPSQVAQAWATLAAHRLVMFVSPSAVASFMALRPAGQPWPAGVLAAGTGPGTARALAQAGVPAQWVVAPPAQGGQFDSEALWALLRDLPSGWAGATALVVRGEGGRDWLADTLRQHGAQVHFVEAYRRTVPVPDQAGQASLGDACARPTEWVWLFSSSEAAGHLPALAPAVDWSQGCAMATHPRIVQAAQRLGFGQVLQVLPSPQAVASAVRGLFAQRVARAAATPPSIQSRRP